MQESADRFDQKEFLPEFLGLESLCWRLESVQNSFRLPVLRSSFQYWLRWLSKGLVCITTIQIIRDAMNEKPSYKVIFSKIHRMLWLYLTVPVISATSERMFSAFKVNFCVFTINFDREATEQ